MTRHPTNPADASGRRLLDGDRPDADWNTCVGHNGEDLAVTFDLQGLRRLARVRVSMPLPKPPENRRGVKYVTYESQPAYEEFHQSLEETTPGKGSRNRCSACANRADAIVGPCIFSPR